MATSRKTQDKCAYFKCNLSFASSFRLKLPFFRKKNARKSHDFAISQTKKTKNARSPPTRIAAHARSQLASSRERRMKLAMWCNVGGAEVVFSTTIRHRWCRSRRARVWSLVCRLVLEFPGRLRYSGGDVRRCLVRCGAELVSVRRLGTKKQKAWAVKTE